MAEGPYKRIVVVRNASGRTGLSAYQQAVKDGTWVGNEHDYAAYPLQSGEDAVAAAAEARLARDAAYASRDAADVATAAADTATTQANTARDQANTARDAANTATTQANTARDNANTATAAAGTATGLANTATTAANAARDAALASKALADTATTQANTARDGAIVATGQANTATTQANTARDGAIAATTTTNTATTQANTARDAANAAAAYVNDLLTQQIGQTWVNYSSARVLTAADNGKLIAMTSTGINFIYADAGLPADFRCEIMRLTGAGQVIVAGGVGATVTGTGGLTALATVNASAVLRNVVPNQLVLSGPTSALPTISINRPTFISSSASSLALAWLV